MTDVQGADPSRSIELVTWQNSEVGLGVRCNIHNLFTSDGQEVDSEVIHVNRDLEITFIPMPEICKLNLANRLRGISVYQDSCEEGQQDRAAHQ